MTENLSNSSRFLGDETIKKRVSAFLLDLLWSIKFGSSDFPLHQFTHFTIHLEILCFTNNLAATLSKFWKKNLLKYVRPFYSWEYGRCSSWRVSLYEKKSSDDSTFSEETDFLNSQFSKLRYFSSTSLLFAVTVSPDIWDWEVSNDT